MSEERDPIAVELEEVSATTLIFTKCGHTGPAHFRIKIWDDTLEFKVPESVIKKSGTKEHVAGICPECFAVKIGQTAIRCCKCGKTILIDDPVSLYPKGSDVVNNDIAEYAEEYAIGCLRIECCPSGGFFAGHWTTIGFKPAF